MANRASGGDYGRQMVQDGKLRMYMRDNENTMMYSPQDYTGNKFLGAWNKVMLLQSMIFAESREKYLNKHAAAFKSKLELESIPHCFDHCVGSLETAGLNPVEKNCMRDCYLKRVSSRDDLNVLIQQKLAFENTKAMRERQV